MTETSTLIFSMNTIDGVKKFSYKYANPENTVSTVQTAANALIANGSIFEFPPVSIDSVMLRTVTEDMYDLSE